MALSEITSFQKRYKIISDHYNYIFKTLDIHMRKQDTRSHSFSKSQSKSKQKSMKKKQSPHLRHTVMGNKKKTLDKELHYISNPRPSSKAEQIFKHDKASQKFLDKSSKSKSNEKFLKESPYSIKMKINIPKIFHKKDKKDHIKTHQVVQKVHHCQSLIHQNKLQEAKTILLTLEKEEESFDIQYMLATVFQRLDQNNQASLHFRSCISMYREQKKNKKNSCYIKKLKLAKCYFYFGQHEQVINICNTILMLQKNFDTYFLKGQSQLKLQKFGNAIDSLTNALDLKRNSEQVMEFLGDCYRGINAFERALKFYTKVHHVSSKNILHMLQKKAECFKQLGIEKQLRETTERIFKIKLNEKSKGRVSSVANFQQVQQQYEKRNLDSALDLVEKVIASVGESVQAFYWNVLLLYEKKDYGNCEKKVNQTVRYLQNLPNAITSTKKSESQLNEITMIRDKLKEISCRLKEINAKDVIQADDDSQMGDRRKKCLEEALNVFKIDQKGALRNNLSVIMQESSIKKSRFDQTSKTDIFLLRPLREVMKNWCQQKFSLQSLEKTTDLAYKLVKIRYKQFSVLPVHIIYFTLRKENEKKKFLQINDEINSMLGKMCKKYPPSEANISNSTLRIFDITWDPKPKINLFDSVLKKKGKFANYKELSRSIEQIGHKALQELKKMESVCQKICIKKFSGTGFKIGVKLDVSNSEKIEERVLSRIVEKILEREIKQKKKDFFDDVLVKPHKKLYEYFLNVQQQWVQTVNQIIEEKNRRNQQIQCYVYDFLRAKCMFNSINTISEVVRQFIKLHSQGDIYLLEVDNRLNFKTKDVVLKFKVVDVIGQLQLALEFQSLQNQFNHGLYELFRSPFGPFFASVMWFSGFAKKKNEIFFKEKIKWSLNGLQHLRKFMYQEELPIYLKNPEESSWIDLILEDMEVFLDSIETYICTKEHLYLTLNPNTYDIEQSHEKPKDKFIIQLSSGNFIMNEEDEFKCKLRLQGTQIFINIKDKKIMPYQLDNSYAAFIIDMKINMRILKQKQEYGLVANKKSKRKVFGQDQWMYQNQIRQCREWQAELFKVVEAHN